MWDVQSLFVRYAREIDRFLRRRGHSAETAADLTQDTFVRAMVSLPGSEVGNPGAYLRQVARNLSIDLFRRERLVNYADIAGEEFDRISDDAPSPETIIYDRQRLAIVESALRELPDQTRQAFEMHRIGDRTMSQVAAELGISTSRVWVLVRRAYLHLRSRLQDNA